MKRDEFNAIIDTRRSPACLIGRRVRFDYRGHTAGTIAEHLGGLRFGILVDGYTAYGHTITVDMQRHEFQLPRG